MKHIEKSLKGRSYTTVFNILSHLIGICLIAFLMIGQAQAGDILSLFKEGTNHASDENREYLIDRNGTVLGQIDVGDSLRGIVGINTLNSTGANVGGGTENNEWTAVYQIKVVSKEEIDSGVWQFTFVPDEDFEADLSGGIGVSNGFVPGPGAIVVMFEDSSNNFALDFDNSSPATPAGPDDGTSAQTVPPSSADVSGGPYATEEAFVALAVDGTHFWTLGFAGVPGEGFVVKNFLPVGDNILPAFSIVTGTTALVFNGGLTRLFNGNTGIGDTVSIAPVTPSIFGGSVQFAVSGSIRGVHDLNTPFEASSNLDLSFTVQEEEVPGQCRMTGGNATVSPAIGTDGIETWTYNFKKLDTGFWITTGGQIGAPSVEPPRGHWAHTQHGGDEGNFTFHSGTSSAPDGTEISTIECADPGWCVQARCAPYKQIFWTGVGNFAKQGFDADALANCVVADMPRKGGTLHFYRAMAGDFGENDRPTREESLDDENPETCDWFSRLPGEVPPGPFDASLAVFLDSKPDTQFGGKGGQICDKCPDYYQIEIHCTSDPASAVIYTFSGFLEGGNYQIHPATGEQCPVVPELVPELCK